MTLLGDVTASEGDAALTVPPDAQVILRLNGKTLNRNLNQPVKQGCVLIVQGSLTIAGEGSVTGGCSNGNGGGVWVAPAAA